MGDETSGFDDVFDGADDGGDTPSTPALPPEIAALLQQATGAPVSGLKAGTGSDEDDADGEGDDDESIPDFEPSQLALMGFADEPQKTQWRRLPRMVGIACRMVWNAARWRAVSVAGLQAVAGIGVGAQLLAGNSLLTRALLLRQQNGDLGQLVPQATTVVVISVVLAILNGVASAQQSVVTELVGNHAYNQIITTASAVDLSRFEDSDFYNRLQRAQAGGQMRPWQLSAGLLGLASSILGSVGIGLALFTLQPMLVLMAAAASVPVWIALTRNARARFVVFLGNTADERERGYLRSVLTDRDPAKEVRAFNLIGYLRQRLDTVSLRILARLRRESWQQLRRDLAGKAGGAIAFALAGATLLWLLVTGHLGVAAAMTAALAMQQLRGRVTGIAQSAGSVYEAALYLEDYDAFLAEAPAEEMAPRPTVAVEPFRRLAAENATFAYSGSKAPALLDVDVEINAGEVVALVGENGSGKTTLAKLLCGLYSPTGGLVTWDGVDANSLDAVARREHITVIFQDFVRYALPARDNVGLGRYQRIDDEVALANAIETAGLGPVFDKLPDGWETVLGRQFTGGQDLSGGQWQRVALARAFFRDASFLVLDEPTASLDARAEHRLFERLRQLAAGRSVLLITHRFGNVRMADRIYVLHRGRVVEHGTHDELMASNGRYAELFNLQASLFLDSQVSAD